MAHETAHSKEHLQPWFDDGNIVLVAEGKCFRVYRGMLSVHSPIFKDMFSCPQPADQEETIEGCAVVHLQDSASELQHVLRALFYGEYITSSSQPMPMSVATALLRLGKKYEIKLLFDHMTRRDFQLLNVVREVGLLTVLPIALYVCACSTKVKKLLDGYEWEGVHYSLSPLNQRACIIGRDQRSELAKRVFANIFSKQGNRYFIGDKTCAQCPARCCATSLPTDPFSIWDPDWDRRFCTRCVAPFKARCNKCRDNAFLLLPSMFDVGSNWEQICKDETSF
ncbi:hypothetical protein EDC04DRAFT_2603393 [Pisolithus marmoratus]|nr:hypothetical protein EDC04DRAFT_2603393 [Pisolithus marmoratus]